MLSFSFFFLFFFFWRLTVWKFIAVIWILFHYECQAQSELEEASWLLPRYSIPWKWIFSSKVLQKCIQLCVPRGWDVVLATKENSRLWEREWELKFGVQRDCGCCWQLQCDYWNSSRIPGFPEPQSGISWGAEQLIWSYFCKSNPFQLVDSLTQGCVTSLARAKDAPSWGKNGDSRGKPMELDSEFSPDKIKPLCIFWDLFFGPRIKWTIILQWCISISECVFFNGNLVGF